MSLVFLSPSLGLPAERETRVRAKGAFQVMGCRSRPVNRTWPHIAVLFFAVLVALASPCLSLLLPRFGLGPLVRGSERCCGYEQLCALRSEPDFDTAADHRRSFTGGEECMFTGDGAVMNRI